jgi:hypothetical protein
MRWPYGGTKSLCDKDGVQGMGVLARWDEVTRAGWSILIAMDEADPIQLHTSWIHEDLNEFVMEKKHPTRWSHALETVHYKRTIRDMSGRLTPACPHVC